MFAVIAPLVLHLVFLSTCIVVTLVANGHRRTASLWQRASMLTLISLLPRLGDLGIPVIVGRGFELSQGTISWALLLGAFALQTARAVRSSPRVELGLAITAASVVCWGGLCSICLV